MRFRLIELRVMGYVAQHKDETGWYKRGAKFIAGEIMMEVKEVKKILHNLHDDGYIEFKLFPNGDIEGAKMTEKAHRERVAVFKALFPDIKSVYFPK